MRLLLNHFSIHVYLAILTTALREHLHEFARKLPNIHRGEKLYRRETTQEFKHKLYGRYSYLHYVLSFARKEKHLGALGTIQNKLYDCTRRLQKSFAADNSETNFLICLCRCKYIQITQRNLTIFAATIVNLLNFKHCLFDRVKQ